MEELIRTDDAVFLSWLLHRLEEAGIEPLVFDGHTAGAYAGVLTAIQSRVMVPAGDLAAARRILAEEPS